MSFPVRIVLALALVAGVLLPTQADAAQTLAQVQAKVRQLEEEATTAAEGAQEAKVKLASLTKTLNGIRAKAEIQGQTVSTLQRSLGAIAIEQYKSGGFGQSFELLFSSDPTLYLSSAGALDAITRRKSAQLRKFEAAQQRLNATTLTVNDKVALVAAAQKKFAAQSAIAQKKLAEAESLLSKLTKAERERLAKLAEDQENADQASSLEAAKSASGRPKMSAVPVARSTILERRRSFSMIWPVSRRDPSGMLVTRIPICSGVPEPWRYSSISLHPGLALGGQPCKLPATGFPLGSTIKMTVARPSENRTRRAASFWKSSLPCFR